MENEKVIKMQIMEFINPIIFGIIGFTIALLFFKKCDVEQPKQVNLKPFYDTLQSQFNAMAKYVRYSKKKVMEYKHQADSLKSIKSKVLPKYYIKKELVLQKNPKDALVTDFVEECDSLNAINNKIIAKQDSTIKQVTEVAEKQDSQINNLQTQMTLKDVELEFEIAEKKEAKRQLRKQKVKTVIVGLALGILTGGVIYMLK